MIATQLERDLQAKFNLTWRSGSEHGQSNAHAICMVCRRSRAVDRTGSAGKEAGDNARLEIEVGKVEEVVQPD